MSASAGRVLIIPKGTYDASATYHMLDLVVYDGSSYIAKQTTTGNLPTNTTYWQLLANGNAVAHLYDVGDVTITNPTTGQILKWNGSAWINAEDKSGLKPHLIILSDHGSTVTVVKGGTTYTTTETSSGTYETDVDEFGTYTIHAVLSGDDATLQLVVDTCKVYTVHDEHFHASITVTYPSGYTCMISGGSETYVATSSPYEFVVHSANTFVITTEDANQNTYTDTVIVTESGQSFSKRCPSGSQLPANDISNWLFSGARSENYTQLSEILADSDCLLGLMTSDNAVDYLARSTSWAASICADENAMNTISACDYATDSLLAVSTWLNAICDSTYCESVLNVKVPTMTSDTTPSGVCSASSVYTSYEAYKGFDGISSDSNYWRSAANSGADGWLGYEFTEAVRVYKAVLTDYSNLTSSSPNTKDFKIEASNDGTNWVNEDSDNTTFTNVPSTTAHSFIVKNNGTSYTKHRIHILTIYGGSNNNISELQFYGRVNGGVQDWLRAGGITNKDYVTLAEVLADSTTLSTLIASHNAMDYLVTAKGLIDIVNDSTAMSLIGLNNYASNTLLADETWLNAICNSTYFESVLNVKAPTMTSNNTPSGECISDGASTGYDNYRAFNGTITGNGWFNGTTATEHYIGYQFTSSAKIYAAKYNMIGGSSAVHSYDDKIQGSNDGLTWTDVSASFTVSGTQNDTITGTAPSIAPDDYTYYRLYQSWISGGKMSFEVKSLQFYGREDV